MITFTHKYDRNENYLIIYVFLILENEKDEKSNSTNEESKKDGGANPWFRHVENSFKEWNLEPNKWIVLNSQCLQPQMFNAIFFFRIYRLTSMVHSNEHKKKNANFNENNLCGKAKGLKTNLSIHCFAFNSYMRKWSKWWTLS